jgi:hypothetical protein
MALTVALTALQWEVAASSDRRRTPVDLARLPGRDTFTVMREVRRMIRADLMEPGRINEGAVNDGAVTERVNADGAAQVKDDRRRTSNVINSLT